MSQKKTVFSFLQTLPRNRVTTCKAIGRKVSYLCESDSGYMRTGTDVDLFPCYKVAGQFLALTGYGLGLEEKTRKLQAALSGDFWISVLENLLRDFSLHAETENNSCQSEE